MNMLEICRTIIIFILILPIKTYQIVISPLFPGSCRFDPTCSNYFIEALKIWGPFKGFWLGIKRISKCHPWGTFGYDPVPEREDKI